ncbi:helix-turn-helix transcriptional regulator [Saccharopolyspora sp. 5N708]|uniref:helix-turn-helix transcriptional regulator n=1 Tax=Saccharopolyspora sp. 5N708 TaxID=3457424 RepID=UPI003FD62E12
MDRTELANFLRARREALQPEDAGLRRGPRRRTRGLRREEVAALSGVSSDYYSRIEQQRGPVPSEQILAAIAHGMHLTLEERDHLFRLAGHETPQRTVRGDHINAGLMRILDRLEDTPAQVENILGETLKQTWLAVALLGDETAYTGLERSRVFRWFTDPAARELFPEEDHEHHSRTLTAHLAAVHAKTGKNSPAGTLVETLRKRSREFADLWDEHPIVGPYCEPKRIQHPRLGLIEVYGQILLDPDQFQTLVIFTTVPGTESHEKLQLLSTIGNQQL